jgi:hypothetical protein
VLMADGWCYSRRYIWLSSLCRLWVLIINITGVVIVIGVYKMVGITTNLCIYVLVPSL